MTTTVNFEIEHLDAGQSGKETTINAAWNDIDKRLGNLFTHNMASDADYTLDTGVADEHRNLLIRITDTGTLMSAPRFIQFPANPGFYIFHNLTAFDLKARVGASGGFVTLGTGTLNTIVSDGTDMFLGAGDGSAAAANLPYDFTFFMGGIPASGEAIRIPFSRAVDFPANLTLSRGASLAAATASTTFTFKKNGTSFGTANFAISATTATFVAASATSFAAGDVFTCDAPTPDLTLSNVGFSLAATRT